MSLMLASNIVKSPHSLAELKSNSFLLWKLNHQNVGCHTRDQILYFPSGRREVEDPKQVFVGLSAMAYIQKKLVSIEPAGPIDVRTTEIAQEFKEAMGCDISYFEGIPQSAYPKDHPLHGNPGWNLLIFYEYSKTIHRLKDNVMWEPIDVAHHQVIFQEEPIEAEALDFLDSEEHDISIMNSDLVKLMGQFMPGTRAAFDVYGNIWISSQTLWGLLTGHFYLPQYWCDFDQMKMVMRSRSEFDSEVLNQAVSAHRHSLQVLESMNIKPTTVPLRIMDESYCWSIEGIKQSTQIMRGMFL